MKTLAVILFTAVCMGAFAQKSDLPPVIVVRLTSPEQTRLAAIQKKVADAQAALQAAQDEEGKTKYEIMNAHRTKEIGPDPMCVAPFVLTNSAYITAPPSGGLYSVGDLYVGQALGYSSHIEGGWIIFSHDIPYCKGA